MTYHSPNDINEAVEKWLTNYLTGGVQAANRRDVAMFECLNIALCDMRRIANALEKIAANHTKAAAS